MDLTLIKEEIPDDLITESSEIGFDYEHTGTENIHNVNASSAPGVEFPLFVLAGYCRLNPDGSCGVRMDLDFNNGRVAYPTVIVPAAGSVEYSGASLDCLAASHASQLETYSSGVIDHVRHSSVSYNGHLAVDDNKLQPVVRLIKLTCRQIQNATRGRIKLLKSKPAVISHENNKQSCVCPVCGRAFISSWMLNRHISYHDRLLISSTKDSSRHLCLTCGKSFKCASKLRFHEAGHIQKSKHIRIVPIESDVDVDVEALSDNDFSSPSYSGVDITSTELIEVKPDTDSDTMDYHRSMRSSESDVEVDCDNEANIDSPVAVFSDKKTLDTDGNTKATCTVDQSDQKVLHDFIAGKCSTSADVAVVRGNDNLRSCETNLQSRNIFEHFPSVMSSENCPEAVHFDFRTSSYVAEFEKSTRVDACSDASWNNSNTTEISVDTKAKSHGKPKCPTSVTSNDQAENLHCKCTDSCNKFKQYTRLCGSQEHYEKMGERCTRCNYICPMCDKAFTTHSSFQQHMVLHNSPQQQSVEVVSQQIERNCVRNCSKPCRAHHSVSGVRADNGGGLHYDSQSKNSNSQASDLRRHYCQICGMSFKLIFVLKRHLKIHEFGVKGHGARNYVCPDCYKSFQGMNTFLKHMHLHSDNYPHVCDVCSKHCTSAGALREHNRLNHDDSKKHVCGQCGKIFPLAISLINHKRAHSKKRRVSAKPSRYCCQICGISFKFIHVLKRHLKIHEFGVKGRGARNYVCPDCYRSFQGRNTFLKHLKLHSENYPHVCGECGKRCTSAGALREHNRLNHDDSKKHTCGQCGKVFRLAISLIRHKIVHSKKTCASTKALSLQLNLKHDDSANVDAQTSDKSENDLKHFTGMTACLGAISTSDPNDNSSIPHIEDMLQTNGMLEVTAGSTFDASDNVNISHFADKLQSTDNHLVASIKIRRRLDKGSKSVNSRSLALNLYRHHCDACGLSFNTIDKLTRHAENHKFCHNGQGAPNYVCPECHTTFQHRNRFMQHLKLHSENHPPICDVCNKRCFSATTLNEHYKLYHDNSKELACEQCGKTFSLAISMIRHKISHSVKTQKFDRMKKMKCDSHCKQLNSCTKNFACPECPRRFKFARFLEKHLLLHAENYPHVCDVCNKRCCSAEALLQHFDLRHDSSTEHRCERCGKVFTAKISLIKHHHRCPESKSLIANVYNCTRCSKSFRYPAVLRRHVSKHHNLTNEHKLSCENGIDCATLLASGITALGGLDEKSEHAGVESNAGLDSSILANDSVTHQTNHVAIDASNVKSSSQAGDTSIRLSGSCSDADKLVTPFVCKRCGKSFQFAADLGEHDRQYEQGLNSDTAFMCCHCCKSFLSKCAVQQHMYMISDSNPYKCSVCQKALPSSELLAQHKLQGCDSQACRCVDCGEKFTNSFSLIKHLEIRHGKAARQRRRRKKKQGEQPLICSECGKLFRRAYRLETHLKRHSGERSYICDYCSSSFVDCQSLNNHRRIQHINVILGKYPCTVCDKKCGGKQQLRQHMIKHDSKPAAALFSCDLCTCKFKTENFLRKHLKTVHLGIPRARKAVSDQTLASKAKRFACRFCLRSFSYKQTMLDHECTHTGVKRFRCSECEKSFITKTQLDEHVIVMHTNVKAFACPDCGRKFALRKAMNRHIKNVHSKGAQT